MIAAILPAPIFTAALQLKYSLAGLTALVLAQNALSADTVIHAGTLIDGVSAAPRQNVSITIRDDKIVAVENGFTTPSGAHVIDLSGSTVLPGFIDCHVHVAAMLPSHTNATEYWVTHNDIDRAFDGQLFARQMLQQASPAHAMSAAAMTQLH